MLTIGELAERVGLRTSALRYYGKEELLIPDARSEAGYRLYAPEAEDTLRFIQQAQRLGFSLADIRTMLRGVQDDSLSGEDLLDIAQDRLLDLERRLTESLVVHHEMESFLQELERLVLQDQVSARRFYERLIGQVCASPPGALPAQSILEWLVEQTGCGLSVSETGSLLEPLRGQHVHLWQVENGYEILVVGEDPVVLAALQQLAQIEASCEAHPQPRVREHKEGYLLVARGENAFIFARLFLALERE
jgi:MerR family Zn(II)-responsive transcriptional regulator of zntA